MFLAFFNPVTSIITLSAKMRFLIVTTVVLPILAHGSNIIMSNDDGWAEINLRTFYNTLVDAGESAVVSAPAENKSGTGTFPPKVEVLYLDDLTSSQDLLMGRQMKSMTVANLRVVLLGVRQLDSIAPILV